MFEKNKNAIVYTHMIIKVRKYKDNDLYFSLYSTPAIADETKAKKTVEKLNELAKLENKDGWQEQYYTVPLTL